MSLQIGKLKIKSANFNGESSLPAIASLKNVQLVRKSKLDEDDGLFVGYGFVNGVFPYKMQDQYDRSQVDKEYMSITLENKYLKAVFLPEFGGRLWSLYDKENNCDLLYVNKVIRPCNLALRNAWLSGGVEFNIGMVGHSPFTCSPIFTATTKLDDGTPVLRFYAFERIRRVVYQMDFFLPEDAKFLYARIRIVNPLPNMTPMYWWSNIAVLEGDDYRNIIDATNTYSSNEELGVYKKDIPYCEGSDHSYPRNIPTARDYFFNLPADSRKFTTYLDKNGYGLLQTSTKRLQGRKLFVWGQGLGGKRWQEFLTEDNCKDEYVEIQAGLAKTQYECIPMPQKTAWEWIEAYGSISVDKEKAHGEWAGAIDAVKKALDKKLDENYLEELLVNTHKMATTKAEKVLIYADGWGALENLRRQKFDEPIMCEHLDFGSVNDEQKIWLDLLNNGSFDKKITNEMQASWMLQPEWTSMIEKSDDCYTKFINLATIYLVEYKYNEALLKIKKALKYKKTPLALFILAQIQIKLDNELAAGKNLLKAYKMCSNDISLCREAFKIALNVKLYKEVAELYENALENIKNDGRIKMYYAEAIFRMGNPDKAYEIITENGGVVVADIREGEVSLTQLYIDILIEKAKRKGEVLNVEDIDVPKQYDFRMRVPNKKQ